MNELINFQKDLTEAVTEILSYEKYNIDYKLGEYVLSDQSVWLISAKIRNVFNNVAMRHGGIVPKVEVKSNLVKQEIVVRFFNESGLELRSYESLYSALNPQWSYYQKEKQYEISQI